MTIATLTAPWIASAHNGSRDRIKMGRVHEDVIWLVESPVGDAPNELRFNVNDHASMADFVSAVQQSYVEQTEILITLARAEDAIRDVLALGALRADKDGWLVMSRYGYRVLGLKPPFWLWR